MKLFANSLPSLLSLAQVARHLGVDVQSGLSLLEVSVRQGLVPPNELEHEPEVCVLCAERERETREGHRGRGRGRYASTAVGVTQAAFLPG